MLFFAIEETAKAMRADVGQMVIQPQVMMPTNEIPIPKIPIPRSQPATKSDEGGIRNAITKSRDHITGMYRASAKRNREKLISAWNRRIRGANWSGDSKTKVAEAMTRSTFPLYDRVPVSSWSFGEAAEATTGGSFATVLEVIPQVVRVDVLATVILAEDQERDLLPIPRKVVNQMNRPFSESRFRA